MGQNSDSRYVGSYYHPHYNDIEGPVGLEESMCKLTQMQLYT